MISTTPTTSATQQSHWRSADGLASVSVTRTSHKDERGATGWSYYISVAVPDGVGFGYTFADARELIYTPGNDDFALPVLNTLTGFLNAWNESLQSRYPDSENRDLFPKMCEPITAYVDELDSDVRWELARGAHSVRPMVGIGRDDAFPAHVWPGGYPIAYITQDGAELCAVCVNAPDVPTHDDEDAHDGWCVVGVTAYGATEDYPTEAPAVCDHCSAVICEVLS